ncbi:MAG: hypothetical protein KME22_08290 [Hassallia sp. WJT32-NPBG1]|nr:hypothetical protein [Hassallia sp. WJT32-NPBG1]
MNQSEVLLQTAQAELSEDVQKLLEKLASFEVRYPNIWKNLNETVYSKADMNVDDAVNILQALTEILPN